MAFDSMQAYVSNSDMEKCVTQVIQTTIHTHTHADMAHTHAGAWHAFLNRWCGHGALISHGTQHHVHVCCMRHADLINTSICHDFNKGMHGRCVCCMLHVACACCCCCCCCCPRPLAPFHTAHTLMCHSAHSSTQHSHVITQHTRTHAQALHTSTKQYTASSSTTHTTRATSTTSTQSTHTHFHMYTLCRSFGRSLPKGSFSLPHRGALLPSHTHTHHHVSSPPPPPPHTAHTHILHTRHRHRDTTRCITTAYD